MDNQTIQSHCGPNGFSPPAPPELCGQVNHVPEPNSLVLVLLAGLILAVIKGRRKWAKAS